MRKPPPPESSRLRLTVKDLAVSIPTVVALFLVAGLIGYPLTLSYQAGQERLVKHEEQRWTTSAERAPVALASMAAKGALPAPDPRQRKPPCADDMGEEEFNGVCWLWIGKPPPCPPGKAWEQNGKCYARVLEVKTLPRPPTSGGEPPVGVADP